MLMDGMHQRILHVQKGDCADASKCVQISYFYDIVGNWRYLHQRVLHVQKGDCADASKYSDT